jgi:hypothetical protein
VTWDRAALAACSIVFFRGQTWAPRVVLIVDVGPH